MDTDGGHDRAARRRELKREWKKAAAAFCAEESYATYDRMLDAYRAWKNAC